MTAEETIARALRRARRSGLFWEGAFVLGLAAVLAFLGRLLTLRTAVLAAAVAALLGLLRAARRWDDTRAARAIEAESPLSESLLAWVAGRGGSLRPRLAWWIAARPLSTRHVRLRRAAVLALLSAGLAGSAASVLPRAFPAARAASKRLAPGAAPALAPVSIDVDVTPPAYTGLPRRRSVLASDGVVCALAGSNVSLSFSDVVSLTVAGSPSRTTSHFELTLRKNDALRIERPGDATPRLVSLKAVPDEPPVVVLTKPAEDATTEASPPPFDVVAEARDDFGLARTSLHVTLAHGRGEGMSFRNATLDATVTGDAHVRTLRAHVDPAALGLKAGDTLVLWAEASDRNDTTGPGVTRSVPRVLRWEEKLSTLDAPKSVARIRPEDQLLSEREILARTERLLASRLPPAARRERTLDLADDQRRLRERYGQFTHAENGEAIELDVETAEASETDATRSLRLLVFAVDAMWAAERALSVSDLAGAIPHERRAVKLLEDAFGLERYALRALAAPSTPVDTRARLTGDPKGLAPALGAPYRDEDDAARRAALRALAARLLDAALDRGATPRALGDLVFGKPQLPGFDPALEASALYASRNGEAAQRAHDLSQRLLALADGSSTHAAPRDPSTAAILERLPGR